MSLSTAKDILLPIAAIFIVCPVLLAGMLWVGLTFGPLSIIILMVGAGVAAALGLVGIALYERRNIDLAKRRLMIAEAKVSEAERRLAELEANQRNNLADIPPSFDPTADGHNP